MLVNLFCIGDVVGGAGRRVLREGLAVLKPKHAIDCTIANVENVAGGSGLTAALYDKMLRSGVDLMTLGDHIYRRRDIVPVLERSDRIVRPANYPTGAPGKDVAIFETAAGPRVAVISLMGRMFMKPPTNCAFAAADRVLGALPEDVKVIVVDVHAEVTSEKVAMGWHLDGRVSMVFGTHTHIPTADETILPKGTAYVTDLGMTGPYDSILGRDKDRVLSAMRTGMPTTFDVASGDPRMVPIKLTVDSSTGRATSIERLRFEGAEVDEEG